MAEETALRSMFTDYALETLFPDWTQHPEHAKSICMARLGCNTAHAQISGADTDVKDGITDGYGQPVNIRDVTVVTGADPDPTLVKVTVIVETQGEDDPLRGNTIREIGLFINNGTEPPDWRMVWLSDMPDMYIPRADESGGITVTSKITVPIKFSNAEQINLNTQNEGLAAKIGEVENTVNIMKGSGGATEKADKAITAQLINKLNSGGNPPSTDFPALSDVKKKADADIVGDRPGGLTDSDLWTYVKTLNNGTGTAGPAEQKASASIVGSRPEGITNSLWDYVKILNNGSSTAGQAEQKAGLAATAQLINQMESGTSGETFPAGAHAKANIIALSSSADSSPYDTNNSDIVLGIDGSSTQAIPLLGSIAKASLYKSSTITTADGVGFRPLSMFEKAFTLEFHYTYYSGSGVIRPPALDEFNGTLYGIKEGNLWTLWGGSTAQIRRSESSALNYFRIAVDPAGQLRIGSYITPYGTNDYITCMAVCFGI